MMLQMYAVHAAIITAVVSVLDTLVMNRGSHTQMANRTRINQEMQ